MRTISYENDKMQVAGPLRSAVTLLLAAGMLSVSAKAADPAPRFSFAQPAARWTEAIAPGNGRIDAMDFGGVEDQQYQINESKLRGGATHDYANPDPAQHLDEVRSLIFAFSWTGSWDR